MLIHPDGGKGIGVEAYGSNFPFTEPGPDVRGLLADLYVSHEYRDVVLPLRVARLSGFQQAFDGLPSAAGITIVDAVDATVFESDGAAYWWKDWGARLRVHEWTRPDAVCRAVQHRASTAPLDPWPDDITPESGMLDERASELLPERLLTLSEKITGVAVSDQILLANGWNVDITASAYPEPLRNTTLLTFKADPGGGPGRYPGCQEPDIIVRKIGGEGPDKWGNFHIACAECYYARQQVALALGGQAATPIPGMLKLGNDCDSCCDCDDYVHVQRAVLKAETRLRDTAWHAEGVRDEFVVAKQRWEDNKARRERQLLRLKLVPTAGKYVEIFATVCNATAHCLRDVIMTIDVLVDPNHIWAVGADATRITSTCGGAVPYTLNYNVGAHGSTGGHAARAPGAPLRTLVGSPGTMAAYFDAIQPMTNGRLRTRISFMGKVVSGTFVTVTVTVNTYDPDDRLFPQLASTTVTM